MQDVFFHTINFFQVINSWMNAIMSPVGSAHYFKQFMFLLSILKTILFVLKKNQFRWIYLCVQRKKNRHQA